MTVLGLQARMREVGRIRMGDQTSTSKGTRPRALDVFRLTSRDRALLDAAAVQYGGEVTEWREAPGGPSWQLYTESSSMPCVLMPRILELRQSRELWSGGGCLRRCNGEWDQVSDGPCVCAAEDDLVCQLTTRLSVILHELPVSGCWRLESHGYYAAAELKGSLGFIGGLAREEEFVPVVLRLDPREVKRPGEPVKRFVVPVLVDPENRLGALLAGVVGRALPPAPRPEEPQQAGTQPDPDLEPAAAEVVQLAGRRALTSPVEATATVNRAPMPHRAPAPRTRDALTGTEVHRAPGGSDPTPAAPPRAPLPTRGPSTTVGSDGKATRAQVTKLQAMYRGVGIDTHEDRVMLASSLFERDVLNTTDLSWLEASRLIEVVEGVSKGELEFTVNDEGQPVGVVQRVRS